MTSDLTAIQDDTRCPRCGSGRLLRRRVRLERPWLRDGMPLSLWRRWRRALGAKSIERRIYHCEMCGHQWVVDTPLILSRQGSAW